MVPSHLRHKDNYAVKISSLEHELVGGEYLLFTLDIVFCNIYLEVNFRKICLRK